MKNVDALSDALTQGARPVLGPEGDFGMGTVALVESGGAGGGGADAAGGGGICAELTGCFISIGPTRSPKTRCIAMRRVIQHRGPDDFGIHLDGNVGLGFNRLSIIDLSGGHQPMCNEDGTVWIVFNGEIYNFEELRQELLTPRPSLSRHAPIPKPWCTCGRSTGSAPWRRLRGMFAYAIWDSRQRVLFVARDRLGIKPLYYFEDREQFRLRLGNEVRCWNCRTFPARWTRQALAQYLRHRYVIAPDTMLRGIRKLPPGHSMTVRETGSAVRRYWEMPLDGPREISEAEALEEFGALLDETMRQHLVADVPLGAFLSGGLDSSSVVALMAKIGVQDIKTFSIGYDSPESELPYARIVADAFHTDHHELRLSATGFRDVLPKIVWYMDEPVGNEASLPLYLISEFARKKVTVALSGEGADEILGGYDMYRVMLAYEKLNRVPLAGVAGKLLKRFGGDRQTSEIRQHAGTAAGRALRRAEPRVSAGAHSRLAAAGRRRASRRFPASTASRRACRRWRA